MSTQFLTSNPVLPVKSVIETAKFFEEKLGFITTLLWKNPPYGIVKRGNAVIEFGEGRQAHAGSGVCIILVDNADSLYAQWRSNGVDFVGDFADRDYGSKDFRVRDNNGNMLIVGHALENQQELLQQGNVA